MVCKAKYTNGVFCTADVQCMATLYCDLSNGCKCENSYYWTGTVCAAQKLYGVACPTNTDIECRTNLGLTCVGSICSCVTGLNINWYNNSECKPLLTYAQSYCLSTSDCDTSKGLICNTGYNCGCPTASTVGMCDCPHISGNEKYWDGTNCVNSIATCGTTCSRTGDNVNNQCQELTLNLECANASNVCE